MECSTWETWKNKNGSCLEGHWKHLFTYSVRCSDHPTTKQEAMVVKPITPYCVNWAHEVEDCIATWPTWRFNIVLCCLYCVCVCGVVPYMRKSSKIHCMRRSESHHPKMNVTNRHMYHKKIMRINEPRSYMIMVSSHTWHHSEYMWHHRWYKMWEGWSDVTSSCLMYRDRSCIAIYGILSIMQICVNLSVTKYHNKIMSKTCVTIWTQSWSRHIYIPETFLLWQRDGPSQSHP